MEHTMTTRVGKTFFLAGVSTELGRAFRSRCAEG